jgi:hypothetical protein
MATAGRAVSGIRQRAAGRVLLTIGVVAMLVVECTVLSCNIRQIWRVRADEPEVLCRDSSGAGASSFRNARHSLTRGRTREIEP